MTSTAHIPFLGQTDAHDGTVVVIRSSYQFALEPAHPMRDTPCVLCHLPAGDELITVVGAGALSGRGCRCGSIPSDLFLIHASHFPIDPDVLVDVLADALSCTQDHDRFDVH